MVYSVEGPGGASGQGGEGGKVKRSAPGPLPAMLVCFYLFYVFI